MSYFDDMHLIQSYTTSYVYWTYVYPSIECLSYLSQTNQTIQNIISFMCDSVIIPSRNFPQIPREVKENLSQKKKSSKKCHLRELEAVPSGAPFGQINPICLFLPAVIYFRWFLALLMLFEVLYPLQILQDIYFRNKSVWKSLCWFYVKVILHMWAHHKNKTLKNASVYFRSPFHAISAEFCALCRNENCMNRIGKLQQIRMHKFLRQCNYMKRVVTWIRAFSEVSNMPESQVW